MNEKRAAYESPLKLIAPTARQVRGRRPASIVGGAGVVFLRALAGGLWLVALAAQWDAIVSDVLAELGDDPAAADALATAGFAVFMSGGILLILFDMVLAVLIWHGVNWARVVVMLLATVSITTAYVTWTVTGKLEIETTLLTISLDILVLLALSSRASRAYARAVSPRRAAKRAAALG